MKNKLVIIVVVFAIILTGCSGSKNKSEGNNEKAIMLKYLSLKYNQSFTIESYKAGRKLNKTSSYAYVKDKNGRKVSVKAVNNEDKYGDSYIGALKSDQAKKTLSTMLQEFYTDFTIKENLYQCVYYNDTNMNISVEDYLANYKTGIRFMIYINSDDSIEDQRRKVKEFSTKIKDNNIKIEALYFAFFDDSVDVKKIKVDYSYEFVLDAISRNSKYSKALKNAYDSMWQIDKGDYNYMQKK